MFIGNSIIKMTNQQQTKQSSRKLATKLNSEARLRAIIETSIEGIITIDHEGIVQSFNPAAEKIFAYSANEVIGNNVSMLMPSPYRQEHDSYLKNYLTSGNVKIIGIGRELKATRKDGIVFPVWLSVAEFIENGEQFFTGFIRDLTAEKTYLKKVTSFEHILENSINEIYIFDADDLHFIDANRGALMNLQYSSSEIIKLTPVDIKPEYSLEKFRALIDPLRSGREDKIVFTTMHQRKDGSRYPVEVHLELSSYEDRSAYIAIILDISRRRKIEESLRLSEEELRLIFENAPTGVALLDLDGNYLNVNPSLCDILGYSKPELLKLSYKDITHPDDIEISKTYLHKLLNGKFSGFSIDKRYIRKDKKIVKVMLNVAVVHENIALAHDDKGNPALLISHVLDISEQIEAEEKIRLQQEQLAHKDRVSMMGEMAAGIAHEINQPLTAIDSYAQAAQRRIKAENIDFEKLQGLLEKISKASVRAGDVISRLRSMVKREAKQHEHFNINALIEEAVKMVEADTQAIEFKIKLELDDGLLNIMADTIQIQQVILNLVRNAMDAEAKEAEKYKQVIIRSALLSEKNRIQVSVLDYGCGIDETTAEELFNPFFTTKSSGMGMGLAICQSIIQMHGGRLWFIPNSDKGTTFHFTLPTALEENE